MSSGLFCLSRLSFALRRRCFCTTSHSGLRGLVVPRLLRPALPPSRPAATLSHLCDKGAAPSAAPSSFFRSLPSIILPLLLVCPCVCVHFPFYTIQPLPHFSWGRGGHQPQSMGPRVLSPLPCPVPCLCSEAVCCGSTNARVRRKAHVLASPHAGSGPWLPERPV